ncbi:uncharacterized protein DS421_20g694930 [Arachis hypogaea]|nr:uncharacterized protein DS421_20g694930 [Arachis hypogaea]
MRLQRKKERRKEKACVKVAPPKPGCMQIRQNFQWNLVATNPEAASATAAPSSSPSPCNRFGPKAEAESAHPQPPPLSGTAPIPSTAPEAHRRHTLLRALRSSVLSSPAVPPSARVQRTPRSLPELCIGAPPSQALSQHRTSRNRRVCRREPPAHPLPPPCAGSASQDTARTAP